MALIEHLPWAECVKKYDRPHTLFYFDPPYWETAGYGVPFEFEEYEAMRKVMDSMNGKAILSINDHPDIRQVFRGLPQKSVPIRYTVGGNGKKAKAQELIIFNF